MDYDLPTEKVDITKPCTLNSKQTKLVDQIIAEPIYKIESTNFEGRAMKMGVKLRLSNKKYGKTFDSLPDINNEIKKIWIKELSSFGRMWMHTRGIIPYKIMKNGNFMYPVIAVPKTGSVHVSFHVKKNRNVYFWISCFAHQNTKKFKSSTVQSGSFKYDPTVFFFRIKGEEPDHLGYLRSKLSHIIGIYRDLQDYEKMLKEQERKKGDYPMILEAELPKTSDQIKMIKELHEINIEASAEEDGRQKEVDPDVEMADDVHNMEIVNTETYRNTGNKFSRQYNFRILKEEPFWPRQRGMQFKFLPGQKFHDYKIQEMQVKVDYHQENFERILSAMLGSVFKPWSKDPFKSVSDAYLV